jgi:hypothetical protein
MIINAKNRKTKWTMAINNDIEGFGQLYDKEDIILLSLGE